MKRSGEWGVGSVGIAALLVVAGCGGEGGAGTPAPVPFTGADASSDVSAEASGDAAEEPEAAADAITPKRTVVTRNPFGNVAHTGNLLLDGDFEFSGPGYMSQYPWLMIGPAIVTFEAPTMLTGYACRSGLRCASLAVANACAGIGLRSKAPYLKVSAWLRPPTATPDCGQASLSVGSCFFSSSQPLVDPVSSTPEADGWCHFESVVAAPDDTPCLFVSNDMYEDVMILDDVVIEPSETAQSSQRSLRKPSAAHVAKVVQLRESVRELFKPKPPSWADPRLKDPETRN